MGACLSVICCSVLITEDILSWTFVLMRDTKSTVSKSSMNFSFLKVVYKGGCTKAFDNRLSSRNLQSKNVTHSYSRLHGFKK